MSETTNLKLNKHDNVSTNTNQFDIDNYLNANWDKIDEGVGKDRERLQILELENERLKQDLNGLPQGRAEGESIDLTDSADMRFNSFKVRGNSKQESRSGNLYNKSTNTSNSYFNADGNLVGNHNWIVTDYISVTPEKAFYIKGNNNLTEGGGVYGAYYNSNKELISTFPYSDYKNKETTINIPANVNYVRFSIYKYADNTTTFDFYTEGPSPDYPSEVESCGDNVNLFDGELELGRWSFSTGRPQEYANYVRSKNAILVKPNTIYTASCDVSGLTLSFTQFDENMTFINALPNKQATYENCKYIKININDTTNVDLKVKLEQGSKATPYTPYGQGSINEVVCNKNLNTSELYDGGLGNNGEDTATSGRLRSDYIEIKPNKEYTLSNDIYLGYIICTYDENKKLITRKTIFDVNSTTFTTEGNAKYLRFSNVGSSSSLQNDKNTIYQLECGSKATNKVLHQSQTYTIPTQQPMRSIGDIRDTFVKVDGKWVERHNIGEVIVDGTEGIGRNETYNYFAIPKTITDLETTSSSLNACLSNYGTATTFSMANNENTNKFSVNGSYVYLGCYGLDIDTVEKISAKLQETNMTIDYILKTPIDIECTPEQTAILDEIENTVKSHKGVTHIYSTDNVGPNVEVRYFKDLDTMINNINTAIVAMGGV